MRTKLQHHGPSLATRMRQFGDAELTRLADELDAARDGFYASPQTVTVPKLLAAWARARKAYEAAGGEPLL